MNIKLGDTILANVNNKPNGFAVGYVSSINEDSIVACFGPLVPFFMGHKEGGDVDISISGSNFATLEMAQLKSLATSHRTPYKIKRSSFSFAFDDGHFQSNLFSYTNENEGKGYERFSDEELYELFLTENHFVKARMDFGQSHSDEDEVVKLTNIKRLRRYLKLDLIYKGHVSGNYCRVSCFEEMYSKTFSTEAEYVKWATQFNIVKTEGEYFGGTRLHIAQ